MPALLGVLSRFAPGHPTNDLAISHTLWALTTMAAGNIATASWAVGGEVCASWGMGMSGALIGMAALGGSRCCCHCKVVSVEKLQQCGCGTRALITVAVSNKATVRWQSVGKV